MSRLQHMDHGSKLQITAMCISQRLCVIAHGVHIHAVDGHLPIMVGPGFQMNLLDGLVITMDAGRYSEISAGFGFREINGHLHG